MRLVTLRILALPFLASLLVPALARGQEEPLTRINFGSCIRQDRPMPIFDRIIDQEPDLFVFLGDNIYADTEDMNLMRARYALLGLDAGFDRLRKETTILATWDDHDFGVNDGGATYPRKVESQEIFADFWNLPGDAKARHREGIYDSHTFGPEGQQVQVILLDTRFFRGPLMRAEAARTGGPYRPTDDTSIAMLGERQWEWLREQLHAPAEIRIIASSIQFAAEDAGQETWSNLPHERKRMLELIEDTKANGVLFISGDRHWSELSAITDDVSYPIYDLTSSSLNQPHPRGTPTDNTYRFLDTTYHLENFGRIEIDWSGRELLLEIVDGKGRTKFSHQVPFDELSR